MVALFKQEPRAKPVTILCGDAREMLRTLPPKSVQCIVTSFPYLWKRDYGLPPTIWGETRDCCHQWGLPGKFHKGKSTYEPEDIKTGLLCENCAAFLGQFGNEPTPELFVRHCVEVSQELWRVLRDDGVFWLNLGNTHASGGNGGGGGRLMQERGDSAWLSRKTKKGWRSAPPGYKHKSLIPVAWMVGIALTEDGWILRADNVWQKTNCVPESHKDRSTISHEYVLQLVKRPRYYWDFKAVQEPCTGNTHSRGRGTGPKTVAQGNGNKNNASFSTAIKDVVQMRTLRSVWTFPTEQFKGLHYATFPRRLAEICIKASTSEVGCCPWCGASWRRMVRKENREPDNRVPRSWDTRKGSRHKELVGNYSGKGDHGEAGRRYKGKHDGAGDFRHKAGDSRVARLNNSTAKARDDGGEHDNAFDGYETIGWEMTCKCPYATPVPATVLDPFGGSGTVGLVARDLGRHAILIDLKPEYCELAEQRLSK